jgi:predicted nucleic acid-binding protein
VTIVADSGPLISFAVIGRLDILESIYNDIVIPPAVWQELEKHIVDLAIPEVSRYKNNIVPVSPAIVPIEDLGPGETEAILLFEQLHAHRLLIEDSEARLAAETRGIPCIGSIGVLINAKKKAIVPALRPLFIELLAKGRYFAPSLLNGVLSALGEASLD